MKDKYFALNRHAAFWSNDLQTEWNRLLSGVFLLVFIRYFCYFLSDLTSNADNYIWTKVDRKNAHFNISDCLTRTQPILKWRCCEQVSDLLNLNLLNRSKKHEYNVRTCNHTPVNSIFFIFSHKHEFPYVMY